MKKEYTAEEMATALGLTKRATSKRATTEEWPFFSKAVRGGQQKLFPFLTLPPDTQSKIIAFEKRVLDAKHASPGAGDVTPPAATGSLPAPPPLARGGASFPSGNMPLPAEIAPNPIKINALRAYTCAAKWRQGIADARLSILGHFQNYLSANNGKGKGKTALLIEYCRLFNDGVIEAPPGVREALPRGISRATVLRWEKVYHDEDMGGLLPSNDYGASPGSRTLTLEMQNFIIAMLWERPHTKQTAIYKGLTARFYNTTKRMPGSGAARHYAKIWLKENDNLFQNRKNPDKHKSSRQPAFGKRDSNITELNQEWELDSTPSDLLLSDGKRYTLIFNIDIYSRRMKILVSPTSKSTSIAALLRNSFLDWGIPALMRTDNGSDYTSKHIERIWDAFEMDVDLCPPFTPEEKPFVERGIQTFLHDLVEMLPGYVGHNINERKDIEARRSFAQRVMGKNNLVEMRMSPEELQKFADRWLKAIYERNPHKGLEGKTPFDMAMDWAKPVRRVGDPHVLDILLAPVPGEKGDGIRIITNKGIRVENAQYIAKEFAAHIGKRALALEDKMDFGRLHIFLDGDMAQPLCVAECPERTGMNRAEVAKLARQAQQAALKEGRKQIKGIAKKAGVKKIAEEILRFREQQASKLDMLPHEGKPYVTAALDAMKEGMDKRLPDQPALTPEQEKTVDNVINLFDDPAPRKELSGFALFEDLEKRQAAGEKLRDDETKWMEWYRTTPDYEGLMLTREDVEFAAG